MSAALAGIFLITEPSRKPWLLLLTRFTEETETQRVLGKVTFAGFNGYETMGPGFQPASFIPELSLSASTVEQARVGDQVAHIPNPWTAFIGKRIYSGSDRNTVLCPAIQKGLS